MRILGIETSCDETAASVVEDGVRVLSNVISSSASRYKDLAGVIPEDAARRQVECMVPVVQSALREASVKQGNIDAIAVTSGPGLLGSLLVGTATARMLSAAWNVPIIGVHHTLGHLTSVWPGNERNPPQFPLLALTVSGGHTDLWLRHSHTTGTLLGRTRDDAVGEAFDKGASILGLPYPGGPAIAAVAIHGDPFAHDFPLPLHDDDSMDFSYSGLKTSLRYLLRDLKVTLPVEPAVLADLAASYQHALCAHLVSRVQKAVRLHPEVKEVHVVGGVSASLYLRELLQKELKDEGVTIRWPSAFGYCTDNAAMIAAAGYFLIKEKPELLGASFETKATTRLEEIFVP